jgi:hypothetical protein
MPPNHLIPPEKLLLSIKSRLNVACLCIHWVVQYTIQHAFLILAGSVYTHLRPFSFLCFALGCMVQSVKI